MNKEFSEYVRSTSFHISLTNRQIRHLLLVYEYGKQGWLANGWYVNTAQALVHKGLLDFTQGKGYSVSEEGSLISQLLKLANYETELLKAEVA